MSTERKLKILLFGATRHTGYHFMKQALQDGHEITAIIRNPSQFDFKHPNLKVVKGDALLINTFETEMYGKDAVISTLGIAGFSEMKKPVILCSKGVENMLMAMHKAGVNRIIAISALPVELNPKMGFLIYLASIFLRWLLKKSYDDMRIMEAELKSSKVNWTVIRPPKLNDHTVSGKYRVAVGAHLSKPWSIARADIAHYINLHLTNKTTYRKIVEIAD